MPTILSEKESGKGFSSESRRKRAEAKAVKVEASSRRPQKEERFSHQRIKSLDKVVFFEKLSVLHAAGIPLAQGLLILSEQTDSKQLSQIATRLHDDISINGQSLSEAMERYPWVFSDVYLGAIKAGEVSGALNLIFPILAEYEKERHAIAHRIQSALFYPVLSGGFLILLCALIPGIFFGDLVDQGFFQGPGVYLIRFSQLLTDFRFLLAVGVVAGLFFAVIVASSGLRSRLKGLLLSLLQLFPISRNLISMKNALHFVEHYRLLNSAGVPALSTLRLALKATGDPILIDRTKELMDKMTEGGAMSEICDFLPPAVSQLVHVGEEAGKLDVTLASAAKLLKTELDEKIEIFLTLLNPLALAVTGTLCLIMAYTVFKSVGSMVNL